VGKYHKKTSQKANSICATIKEQFEQISPGRSISIHWVRNRTSIKWHHAKLAKPSTDPSVTPTNHPSGFFFTQHKEEVNFEQPGNEINKVGQAPTKTDANCMDMVV
jgi:DnaJ-class molecular chaperone